MFCPVCGQQQAAENVRFCSRCGFLLTGISEVVVNQGLLPTQTLSVEQVGRDSPRKRGIKQGIMIFLIGLFLVTPILAMIHVALDTEPFLVAISGIISVFGSIIRVVYALMFEDGAPKLLAGNTQQFVNQSFLAGNQASNALPPQQSTPVTDYVPPKPGGWHTTNDLAEPPSVTEDTTKFLPKDE